MPDVMQDRLKALAEAARTEISKAQTAQDLEALKGRFLGKKGELSAVLGSMGKLAPEERKAVGEIANKVKGEVEGLLSDAQSRLEDAALEEELKGQKLDITLPGRAAAFGRRHPVSQTLEDIVRVFSRLGFEVYAGPEIELDWYNFEALNVPADHPARDMQDTFDVDAPWLPKGVGPVVLRTHTSPVQIRTMLAHKPPLRGVMPGRVYRKDSDQTHTPMFHQVEGLLVDEKVTFAELKGTLAAFATAFFGASTKTRFRPSFFPFTEPSAEIDIAFRAGPLAGRWLEVAGSGQVHPNVVRNYGLDPERWIGFAFGMGPDRLAMLRYGIDDLRLMFDGDLRFLSQFR